MCLSEKNSTIKFLFTMIILFSIVLPSSSPYADETTPVKPVKKVISPDPENEFHQILKQREELRAKEVGLRLFEVKIDDKLKKLELVESRIQQELKQINRVSEIRVKRLIRIYSTIDAKSAARLMEGLDTGQAVEVLAGMKGDISGAILANMDDKTAGRLIKQLAAYKGPKGSEQ
jgi:flagellar motility protein MotE (MotC chaperone)